MRMEKISQQIRNCGKVEQHVRVSAGLGGKGGGGGVLEREDAV